MINKILIIIKREYLTRVRKRSFIVMTILGPILMAAIVILPVYIAQMSDEVKTIAVVDDSGLFYKRFPDSDNLKFVYLNEKIASSKENFNKSGFYALLYIPIDSNNTIVPTNFMLYSTKQPSMIIKSYLENILKKDIESLKLAKSGIDENVIASINTNVNITTIKIKSSGSEERSYSEVSSLLGLAAGILIYFFIFMYGALVLRGVIEEKTNRIIEVIISSVKPFQLMMGKILGIAAVGLTQFLLWVILLWAFISLGLLYTGQKSISNIQQSVPGYQQSTISHQSKIPIASDYSQQKSEQTKEEKGIEFKSIMDGINSINFPIMIFSFLFYFIGGYLLYAALFAAIGAAVDNEADTQQFMLPLTIPLLFSVIMTQFVINNPEGPIAFWLSLIPFTSPVIMMVRIPFGVPYWEIALSIGLLICTFIGTTWMAAKIYRTGILMYGKKISYKEIWKWLKYSD